MISSYLTSLGVLDLRGWTKFKFLSFASRTLISSYFFYEIVRRTAASTPQLQPHRLPPIGQARATLQQELQRQQPLKHAPPLAKQLLHIAINATATTVARHLTDRGYEATPEITTLTAQVRAAAEATRQYLSEQPATGRQHYTARNRNFHHLEGVEAEYITHMVAGLQAENPNASIILLHDHGTPPHTSHARTPPSGSPGQTTTGP